MKKYDYFKKLVEKATFTDEEKDALETYAEKHGISINHGCNDCYRDAAVQLALAYKPKEQPKANDCEYELREDIDVTLHSFNHGSFRVCPALCTKENAEKWIAAGIPLRFFKKLPKDAHNK